MKIKAFLLLLFLLGITLLQAQEPSTYDEGEEIFEFVEEAPFFPGCEALVDETEKKKCSDHKLRTFLAQNIVYPTMARDSEFETNVHVSFVVEKDGNISHAEAIKGKMYGTSDLAEAALNAVKAMNDLPQRWTPGKQRGKPVRVRIILPIKVHYKQ